MQVRETLSDRWDQPEDRTVAQQRVLERLSDLIRLNGELEGMRAGDRPVTLLVMRRAIFGAYCSAIDAGATAEATRMLEGAGYRD